MLFGQVDGLYSTVAAVLSLGNLQFAEEKADQASVSKDSKKWLDAAASNLNLDKVALGERLVTREIKITGQETTHAHLSPSQASDTRLALCKFVYGRMFDWLVARINRSFAGGKVRVYCVLPTVLYTLLPHFPFCVGFGRHLWKGSWGCN